jgi:hypothetical protein
VVQPVADPDVGYLYRDDGDPATRPSGQRISYYFLNRYTGATWVYDPTTNKYGRTVDGAIARDANTKAQITVKNLIVMEVPSQRIMGDPKGRMDVEVIGKAQRSSIKMVRCLMWNGAKQVPKHRCDFIILME